MENKEIASHTELLLRIAELKAEKLKQEDELKNAFSGFVDTLDPVSLIKKTIHDFASDQQVQFDAVKIGMNVGANIIIDQVLGKYRSIKGFFSSLVVESKSIFLSIKLFRESHAKA